MIPLFSAGQIKNADSHAITELGIPSAMLMENASASVFNEIRNFFQIPGTQNLIGIVCGKGNNAGDGFALARHFILSGCNVAVVYVAPPEELSDDALANYNILSNLKKSGYGFILKQYESSEDLDVLENAYLIIDAILGTGLKGPLREPYASLIRGLNRIGSAKASVDIPSGVDADTGFAAEAFKADLTVTLAELKCGLFVGQGPMYAGMIRKGFIGVGKAYFDTISSDTFLVELKDALNGLPVRKKDVHKYSSGRVYIVAGSDKLPGAAVLTARGALYSGAGSVILGIPDEVSWKIAARLTEVIVEPYDNISDDTSVTKLEHTKTGYLTEKSLDNIRKRMLWSDVMVAGPGLGRNPSTIQAVRELIAGAEGRTAVIDADALYALGEGEYEKFKLTNKILTPHMGEFSQLTGIPKEDIQKNILDHGGAFCRKTGAFLVLKGAPTIIFSPSGKSFINSTGNTGMAKFGTGDALTGIIAGIVSQAISSEHADIVQAIEESVVSAVYFHSLSADSLAQKKSVYSVTAGSIIKNFGRTIVKARDFGL